jgi:UDP-N-acetylmuramate dehydrogenase
MGGIEFLAGIPGTVGGAVAVNAGAHGAAVMDRVESVITFHQGGTATKNRRELEFGYRYLRLEPGEIVLEALIRLEPAGRDEIAARIQKTIDHRRTAQQVQFPNAGSFFKNPAGRQAWQLIDQAGIRGATVGGAQVSEQHANFLVNRGGATAADFLHLAALIKEKVRETAGVELEEEVRIVGEE